MTYLNCNNLEIFGGKKPVIKYGIFVHDTTKDNMRIHYCIFGPPIHYKTVVIDGKKVKLHRYELEPHFIEVSQQLFNENFSKIEE